MQNLFVTTKNADIAINVCFALLIFHSGILHTRKLNYNCYIKHFKGNLKYNLILQFPTLNSSTMSRKHLTVKHACLALAVWKSNCISP